MKLMWYMKLWKMVEVYLKCIRSALPEIKIPYIKQGDGGDGDCWQRTQR